MNENETRYTVHAMTCGGCVKSLDKALRTRP